MESQVRFGELSVQGFRRLHDVHLPMRPLCVMIGANGSGKTSILDALSLLANSAQGKLSDTVSELGGLSSILSYDRADHLELWISMKRPNDEPLLYTIEVSPQGTGFSIDRELLIHNHDVFSQQPRVRLIEAEHGNVSFHDAAQDRFIRANWDINPHETSLSQVPKMFKVPEDFRRRLASLTSYHVLDVDPRSPVRLPQPMRPAQLPGKNGEDLVSCLYYLREADRDRFDAIEDTMRAAFPSFRRLDFPPVAAGVLALAWREENFSKPLYLHQLSEGTLRFLWLVTLLQSSQLPALTLIDEPEVSLHPQLLSLLTDLLREASLRSQVVVATHSDRLIRFLRPEEVVTLDTDEGGLTKLTWADSLDLEVWLKDYTLDELWQLGRLGARP